MKEKLRKEFVFLKMLYIYIFFFFIKFMKIYACKANSFNVAFCVLFSFWRFDSANNMKGQ